MKDFIVYHLQDLWSTGPFGILMIVIITVFTGLFVGLILDYALGNDQRISVIILDKTYSPASSSSSVITGVNSDGNIGTGIMFISSSEKFILLVKDDAGKIFTYNVKPDVYISASKSERIDITVRIGYFSKLKFT